MTELLIDTTYLLPAFGVSVGLKNFEKCFEKMLSSYAVYYNPASLIEAKWIVLKLAKMNTKKRDALFAAYRTGLKVLLADARLKETALTNDGVESIADELLTKEEVKDYFDRLIFATAAYRKLTLLTEDEKLSKLKRDEKPSPRKIIEWKDILGA